MNESKAKLKKINKKLFKFAEDIAKLNKNKKGKKELFNLLKTHIGYTNGRLFLNIDSILFTINLKVTSMFQTDEESAKNFLNLSILEQLRFINKEEEIDKNILKKVKKEISPYLIKYIKLNKQLPSPFDHNWVISSQRSTRNTILYNLLIQKSRNIQNLSEIDKSLITLNYYLMLIEGPFEDKIDFIFALIFIVDGKIIIPHWNGGKPKNITKISKILDDHFSLKWKKEGLNHYKMPYLSKCLDNQLRNQIAHLKYDIDQNGQIILEDGSIIHNLHELQEELWDVIRSINEVLLEEQHKRNEPGIIEIIDIICESVKKGKNPFEFKT